MANDHQNDIAAVGGFAVLACVIAMLALVVAIAKGGAPDAPKGVDGADLRLAVDLCTPFRATFEQELACYQAVYGNVQK